MPTCTQRQEHLHLDSVSIQLSVSIYIISATLHAFLSLSSYYRSVYFWILRVITFSLDLVFAEWFCGQRAEIRDNIMIRSDIRGAVKDKVKVKVTDVSRYFFFGASIVSLRPVMLLMWGSLWCPVIWCRNNHDNALPQSRLCLLAVYVMFWSGLEDTQYYLADHSSIL